VSSIGPHCFRCGKFTPPQAKLGWEKNEVRIADLEKFGDDGCEVCKMLMKGLKSYRDRINPQMPLPSAISVKCVPGRSFVVKRPIKRTLISNNRVPINEIASGEGGTDLQDEDAQDFLGPDGLEFFVTPGEKRQRCALQVVSDC
jgi:hypothetical protein